MSGHDDEIDRLKASVSCAVVLERLSPVWRLDAPESSRRSLKFRRGAGEIGSSRMAAAAGGIR
jgi:hypothetical protein